jgi:hypothetical protein
METKSNEYYNNQYNTLGGQTSYDPAMDYYGSNYSHGYYNNSPAFQQYGESYTPTSNYRYLQPKQYEPSMYYRKEERKNDRHRSRRHYHDDRSYHRRYEDHRKYTEPSTKDKISNGYTMKQITITGLDWSFFIEFYSKLRLQGQILNKLVFAEIPLIMNNTNKTIEIKDERVLWYLLGAYDSYKVHEYMEGNTVSPQNVLSLMKENDQIRCKEMIEKNLKLITKSHNSYKYLIHVSTNRMICNIDDICLDDVCLQASVMKEPTVSLYSSAENETRNMSNAVSRQCCYLQMASMEHKWYTLGYTFRNTVYLYKQP